MPSNSNPLQPSRASRRPPRLSDSVPSSGAPPWMPSLARPKREMLSLRLDQILLVILLVNLLVLGTIGIKHLGLTQAPQIACMVLAVALGLVLGVTKARHQHSFIRAFWVILGLVAAGVAWWFVPSMGGVNRWTAEQETQRLLGQLNSMPIADGKSYEANLAARVRLIAEFPELESRFDEVGSTWESASMEQWKKQLDDLPPGDCDGFLKLRDNYLTISRGALDAAELDWFERTYDEMDAGDTQSARTVRAAMRADPAWLRQVRRWEDEWAARTIAAALANADRFLATDPIKSSSQLHRLAVDLTELGVQEKALAKLKVARTQALQASLTATQREALTLLRAGKYQAASIVAERLRNKLANEAQALKLEAELSQIVDSYGFLADLARQANQSDPK